MDDAHPTVDLIRVVKLVTDVNDGTEIVSNIKDNNAAEAVVEAEASGWQTFGHGAVDARAGLIQTGRQVLKFGSTHVSVVSDTRKLENKKGSNVKYEGCCFYL
jgi:hypothetical protein